MNKLISQISEKLGVQKDIDSVGGYSGVDKLNDLKIKYKGVAEALGRTIHVTPEVMRLFVKTKDLSNYIVGVIEKFDRDTINISVVAEVSSGKSTFLNALIFEKKVLDVRAGETTAKVFKISYGENIDNDSLKKKIKGINDRAKSEISKENFSLEDVDINDYMVDLTSGNEKLRKGIVLYDTPGFGTLNEKVMFKLIKEAVNRSDAVILLLDIAQGLKKDEAKFIEGALSYIKKDKRFIVLNKFDSVIDEDEDEDEEDIQDQINKVVSDTKNEICKMSENIDRSVLDRQTYYLSAKKALSGKSTNNPKNLEFSRFPLFEESFWGRIVEAKKETFEENVRGLIEEGAFLIGESNNQIDDFSDIISRNSSLVDNIKIVSKEIKEVVDRQVKIFDSLDDHLCKSDGVVDRDAGLFEGKMKKIIDEKPNYFLSLIPSENAKREDFESAYKKAAEEINGEFMRSNGFFLKSVNSDIVEKESRVNAAIDALNNEMLDEKFKELDLKRIPKIKKREVRDSAQMLGFGNGDFSIEEDGVESKSLSHAYPIGSADIEKDGVAAAGAGATIGGGAGAAIGSFIPVVGTAIGAALGTGIGGFIGGMFGSNNREAELEAEYNKKMQQMQYEYEKKAARDKYKSEVDQAKKDLIYELKAISNEHVFEYISKLRGSVNSDYRKMLSEIMSVINNARNILKDMEKIIEDPSNHQEIIDKNEKKISDLNHFIENVNKCFILS